MTDQSWRCWHTHTGIGMAAGRSSPAPGDRPSPLRTIKRTQRTEEIRRQIEDAIKNGDFGPGDRLPSERELVETFGVSRVSVREAIRSLEAIGLVRVYQGRGAFVSDRRSGLGEPMARWLDLHRDEVLELLGVRGALDEYASALAAEGHDAAEVAAITTAHEAFMAQAANDASAADLVPLDIDFHVAIAEASGNRLLYDLLSDLHSYLAESRYLALVVPGRPARSAAEHARIVEAIEIGDAQAARLATSSHIAGVREVVIAGMHADREEPRRPGSPRPSGTRT
jgi:DNA-binding FadR family transcriptional regulator